MRLSTLILAAWVLLASARSANWLFININIVAYVGVAFVVVLLIEQTVEFRKLRQQRGE